MTRKTKKVRCWLVTGPPPHRSQWIELYESTAKHPVMKKILRCTITPGHFVPDEPKRKARRK